MYCNLSFLKEQLNEFYAQDIAIIINQLNLEQASYLFELIDDRAPGYTMVVAPAGYGKTSLIAEWAKQSKKKVIWYTMSETDNFIGINVYLIAAIREVIPNFAPDLETLSKEKASTNSSKVKIS